MEFKPFSVTCVTCGSRLRVGRPELIDSIVSCPKCQSMVHLKAVETTQPAEPPVLLGDRVVDSNALTEDSISTPELPHQQAIREQPGSGLSKPPPVFTSDPTDAGTNTQHSSDHQPTEHAGAPHPDWHNQKTQKSRKIALSIAVVLASIVSAFILFSVILRNRPVDVAVQQPADVSDTAASDTAASDTAAQQGLTDSSDQPQTLSAETDLANNEDAATDDEVVPLDSTSIADANADPPETLTNAADQETAGRPEKLQPPADLMGDHPILGNNVLEGMPSLSDAPTDDAVDDSTMTELPADLKGLFEGINLDRPHIAATKPALKTIDEIQLDRAADIRVNADVAIDRVKPINMKQALGLPLALQAADPEGYPLNDLMLVLGQLTGVPIEMEWVSFDIVGLPIDQRVRLPANWLTVDEILTAVCDANNATFQKNPTSITVRPTDESFQLAVQQILDLSDIGTENASAVTAARQLLGQDEGDPSRVSVPEGSGQQQLAILVCESIRRIRGVRGKIADQTLFRWAGAYKAQVNAWPRLENGSSGPKRFQPSSFVSVVRQIARLNGATCYINWQDGARRGLRPTDKKMPRCGDGISASQALNQVLQPDNMHVRVVDPSHWWIGSDASFDRFPVVVWFEDEKAASESMRTTIETILEGASAQQPIVGSVTVDPVSSLCVALMPRYLLRQMPRLLKSAP